MLRPGDGDLGHLGPSLAVDHAYQPGLAAGDQLDADTLACADGQPGEPERIRPDRGVFAWGQHDGFRPRRPGQEQQQRRPTLSHVPPYHVAP